MSIPVNINGTTYNLPTQSESPPWGDDLDALLQALIAVSTSAIGPADILTTNFTVANNVAAPTNVMGLSFDTSTVRSAIVSYSIYRSSSTTEMSEAGQMLLTYKSTAGTWELAQYDVGSSGVTFTITNAGQVQYTASNFGGINYVAKMKFKATTFLQA